MADGWSLPWAGVIHTTLGQPEPAAAAFSDAVELMGDGTLAIPAYAATAVDRALEGQDEAWRRKGEQSRICAFYELQCKNPKVSCHLRFFFLHATTSFAQDATGL